MGIIIRQSLKQSIVAFVALLVAAVAQILIYTIDESQTYGAAQQILAIVMLIYPIISFGVPQSLIKFYAPEKYGAKGYLGNFIVLIIGLFTLLTAIYYLFKTQLINFLVSLKFEGELLEEYGIQIGLLIFILMMFKLLSAHMSTNQRIVWPGLFEGLWPKFALAVLVFMVIQGYVSFNYLSWGIVFYYGVSLLGIVIYALFLGKLNLRYNPEVFSNEGFQKIRRFSGYTGLAVFGGTIAMKIDGFMVATLTTGQLTGVYMLFLFLASVVDVPARAVNQISSPIISKANERGDTQEIKMIYRKSANTLFLVAISIFALIFLSINDLFALTKKGAFYSEYFILFGILGLVKIIPTTLGLVNQIILYSKYYRLMLYLTIFIGFINVIMNYIFILTIFVDEPLTGVCIATAISVCIHYLFMVIFIRIKLGIHPFKTSMLFSLLIVLVCYAVAYFIPSTNWAILNIMIKSTLFLIPCAYLVYRFKISQDINNLVDLGIERIKNKDFKNII